MKWLWMPTKIIQPEPFANLFVYKIWKPRVFSFTVFDPTTLQGLRTSLAIAHGDTSRRVLFYPWRSPGVVEPQTNSSPLVSVLQRAGVFVRFPCMLPRGLVVCLFPWPVVPHFLSLLPDRQGWVSLPVVKRAYVETRTDNIELCEREWKRQRVIGFQASSFLGVTVSVVAMLNHWLS